MQTVRKLQKTSIIRNILNKSEIYYDALNLGNSYEKDAIIEWLRLNQRSPITRNRLQMKQLVPNRVLKEIIAEYRLKNNIGDI